MAAVRPTDALIVRLATVPGDLDLAPVANPYARAAYLSWGSLLRKAAADFLDVDASELEASLRTVRTESGLAAEVFLADSLENGAGYCRYLGEGERLREAVIDPLLDGGYFFRHLCGNVGEKNHLAECDTSCYDCLRDYRSSELHSFLDWRLGLDLVRLSIHRDVNVDLQQPHWRSLARKASASLAGLLEGDAASTEDLWTVSVHGTPRAVLHHPLWQDTHPMLTQLEARLGVPLCSLLRANIFDVLRRPGWVLTSLEEHRAQ